MKTDTDPRGARTVGTSLTPEFWRLFAVLLIAATGVALVLTAVLDTLAVRLLRRRVRRPPTMQEPYRPAAADRRTSVRQ
jgi:hypothetical protein